MSKYVLFHGQFHELPDDALMHWKYIKREKLPNGKYKYYYDIGENQKQKFEQAEKNFYTKANQRQSAKVKNISNTRGLKESDKPNASTKYYLSTSKLDDLADKADKAYREYYNTPLYKREARAEKVKENTTKVKNWAKDKLGYDEKQAMETAKTNAKVRGSEYADVSKKNEHWKAQNPDSEYIKDLADWQTNHYRKNAIEAWSKAQEAIKTYEKTPLAKIEKMKDYIDSAKEWYSDPSGIKRAETEYKNAQREYENALKKLNDSSDTEYKDAANRVEYANVRGLRYTPTTEKELEYIENRNRFNKAKHILEKVEQTYDEINKKRSRRK